MEHTVEPAAPMNGPAQGRDLNDVGRFLSGAVLPLGSLSFYRRATRRNVGLAILFFFAFTTLASLIAAVKVGISMGGVVKSIRDSYQQQQWPEITILNGVAKIDGPQPLILFNGSGNAQSILIAADTTGQLTSIDQSHYTEGVLLTRTDLDVLGRNQQEQRVPLSELNSMLGVDPIVINEATVTSAWVTLSAIAGVLSFFGLVLWSAVLRLMLVATGALILWGIASLFQAKVGFAPFIITGLYAVVPGTYLVYVLGRSNIAFVGLQLTLAALFWGAGLLATLSGAQFFKTEPPERLWTALIGIPAIVWILVDYFSPVASPTGPIVLWAITLLTIATLAGLRLYFHLQALQASQQSGPTSAL
jgi:hypothetical protein